MGSTHTAEVAEDDGDESNPLTYTRDDGGETGEHERLRPGISKVESADCPACGGGLVHLPASDAVNPYNQRSMIMCRDCYRAVLVEVLESEEPDADTPDPEEEPNALEVGHEDGDLFELTGTDEPEEQKPDPRYSRERAGFTGYGFSGPVGVRQQSLRDHEDDDEDDEEPEVRTDGGGPECGRCGEPFDPPASECPSCGKDPWGHPNEVERETEKDPGGERVDRYVERFETGVRVKTKIQRGTGTNDRDTVVGEVRRRTLGEAAEELSALEGILRGHLYEVRGWDEDGDDVQEAED